MSMAKILRMGPALRRNVVRRAVVGLQRRSLQSDAGIRAKPRRLGRAIPTLAAVGGTVMVVGGYVVATRTERIPLQYHCDSEVGQRRGDEEEEKRSTDKQNPQPTNLGTRSRELVEEFESIAPSTWSVFTDRLSNAKDTLSSIDLSITSVTTPLIKAILPDWALKIPSEITKLQDQLSDEPGSLGEELWEEAQDAYLTPEISWDAKVRISSDLCPEEKKFLERRKKFTKFGLAKYLGIKPEDIHEDDIPNIAITGSGGGLRAMVASAGSFLRAKETGLLDITTYMAGVSGSCWLMSVFYSSIGQRRYDKVIHHLKDRLTTHFAFPPAVLSLLNTAPTNRYLLRGVVERLKVGYSGFHLVDAYGLALAARLMVPRDEMSVDDMDLKLSAQRKYIEAGQNPLPIYTAVRHEIPSVETEEDETPTEAEKQAAKDESWFQWFEVTPYEFYSEELEAGIPTWSVGRKFDRGTNVSRNIPEMKLPTLFGIFGSAFCATLSHYYSEVRPFIKSLPAVFLSVDRIIQERSPDLTKIHPIAPASIPNYVKGLEDFLPSTAPESLYNSDRIELMDAGMSNNLACYPLLRPGRDIDILIAFDSSAEIQKANWLAVTEGYAKQRKLVGWPVSIGWPKETLTAELNKVEQATPEEAGRKLEQAKEIDAERIPAGEENLGNLGYCTIWVGTKESRTSDDEPPPSKAIEDSFELMHPQAGVTVIYFPLIPNPKVLDVDPETSAYLSTWNFEWTKEEVDKTVKLAMTNFDEGEGKVRKAVKAVYERKKKLRLERESRIMEEVRMARAKWSGWEGEENERRVRHMSIFE